MSKTNLKYCLLILCAFLLMGCGNSTKYQETANNSTQAARQKEQKRLQQADFCRSLIVEIAQTKNDSFFVPNEGYGEELAGYEH